MTDASNDQKTEIPDAGAVPADTENKSNEIKEVVVCGHKYFIDNIITHTDDYDLFKIHDNLRREFGLKIYKKKSLEKEFLDCLMLLKDKPGIAAIFEFELFSDHVSVVVELGTPVDVMSIPCNLLKRRMRQILTAITSVWNAQLDFADISMKDFVETNGGIRLMHVESTLTNSGNVRETTFAPVAHLLNELVEDNRIKMDPKLYKELQRCISKASETEIAQSKHLLNSELFRDGFRVTITKNTRAMTPDPHNLVLMKKRRNEKEVEEEEPVPIRKLNIDDIPTIPYVAFIGIGVFLSSLFVLAMQLTLKSSLTFTGMALKTSWVFIVACGALLLATFKMVNENDCDSVEYIANLKKWTRILVSFVILIIGGKVLELGIDSSDAFEAVSLGVWLIASFIV